MRSLFTVCKTGLYIGCYPTANSSHDERVVCEYMQRSDYLLIAMKMKFQLIATAFLVALSSITLLPQSAVSQQFNPENIVLTYPLNVVNSTHTGTCPSQETLQDVRSEIRQDICLLLNELTAGESTSAQCANCSACCGQNGDIIFEADLTTGASFAAAGSGISLSSQFVGSGMCAKQGVATITFPQPLPGQPQRRLLRF